MEFTSRTVTSLGVDAGTMCWFTCDDNLDENDIKPIMSYLSKTHKKGQYKFYRQSMKEEESRVGKACLIHSDCADKYEQKHKQLEYISTMQVNDNLLISDPCYVCGLDFV